MAKPVKLTALPHQRTFYQFWKPDSIVAMIGGFGTGKSHAMCTKAALTCLKYPGLPGMIVSPTFRMGRDVLLVKFREVMEQDFPFLTWSFKSTEDLITINETRSTILLRSADQPTKLRGTNLGWLGMDEPGLCSREAFTDASGRVRVGPLRLIFLTGTPEGIDNWFYDLFSTPAAPYKTIRGTKRHPSIAKHYEAKLKAIYRGQPELLKAYLNGEFVPLTSGRVYPAFSPVKSVGSVLPDENLDLLLACDFNVHPLAWCVAQDHQGTIRVLSDLAIDGTTAEAAASFVDRFPRQGHKTGVVRVYGDRSGKSGSTRSNETDYQILQRVLEQAGWSVSICVPESNPPVTDRVNAVNALFTADKCLVSESASDLIRSLSGTIWKPGTRDINKPAGDALTHWSDAAGYLIHSLYPVDSEILAHSNVAGSSHWDRSLTLSLPY